MVLIDRLRPRVYTARYPNWMVGRPLLYMSSALASLGDAMFGYGQGIIAAVQVQPSFIHRMFGKTVTMAQIQAGSTGVDPWEQGSFSSCCFASIHSPIHGSHYCLMSEHHRVLCVFPGSLHL
jgi:hypothetical protein